MSGKIELNMRLGLRVEDGSRRARLGRKPKPDDNPMWRVEVFSRPCRAAVNYLAGISIYGIKNEDGEYPTRITEELVVRLGREETLALRDHLSRIIDAADAP